MSTSPGMNLPQLAVESLMRSRRDCFKSPLAAATNKIVTTVDPSAKAVGSTFTLTTYASTMQRRARRITMTINDDDAGGGLSLTVKLEGARWGQYVSETLTATSTDTNDTAVTSVNVYDQLTAITVLAVTADTGDDVIFGIDGTSFGLDFPIDNVADVQGIINVSTVTEAAAVAVSATTVVTVATGGSVAGGSYIKGITLATSDDWTVRYLVSRRFDGMGVVGDWR